MIAAMALRGGSTVNTGHWGPVVTNGETLTCLSVHILRTRGHALARFAGHAVRWGAEMFGTGS
jgi:hypothetical protein